MDEEHLEHPAKGVIRMTDFLLDEGYKVGRRRVRRLMRLMGIHALYPKKRLSVPGKAVYIMPYLLRGLKIDHRNQVWSIDITYIPMAKGFMYLTAIIDVYSRFVVGWSLHNTLDASNCIDVLRNAIARYGTPEIINSDQYDYIYIHPEENGAVLYQGILRFMNDYNYRRRHQGIDRQIPSKLYLRSAA